MLFKPWKALCKKVAVTDWGGDRLAVAMLSGVQPCFQLLRIGSSSTDSAQDLYTFRPALTHSVFRLGRAAELCDVTLDSTSVSRIHAELHAEREVDGAAEGGWKVQLKDRSSHGEFHTIPRDYSVLFHLFIKTYLRVLQLHTLVFSFLRSHSTLFYKPFI